jgi:Spy/CpxP family protein refolding chaperone
MTDKRKAIVLVIVLFVLGIALGGVGTHMWDQHVQASQTHHIATQLKNLLTLTPDQSAKFDAIIATQRANGRALDAQEKTEWDPKWDALHKQGRDNIRAILTPEQQVKFDAFMKNLDEERLKQQQGH